MIYIVFFFSQLLFVLLDLFFIPSVFASSVWIDLSIFFCIGGLSIFGETSLLMSTPLLLIKLSFFPTILIIPLVIVYTTSILLFIFFKNTINIKNNTIFLIFATVLYPISCLMVTIYININVSLTFLYTLILFVLVIYPSVYSIRKRFNVIQSKMKPIL